jgi:thymidylate synthase (FAD)
METTGVKLVSATSWVPRNWIYPTETIITHTARVSNPTNQNNQQTASKLIKYLIKNKHWSPFEMVHMTVSIETSRAIAAQILRHRSFSFQEFSQRYAEATEFITYPARRQDLKNRQNSVDDLDQNTQRWFEKAQRQIQELSNGAYKSALEQGIAKEQARFLLPLSTKTKLYMCGSARSWIHYIQLRTEAGTQKEHRDIAEAIKDIFCDVFPDTADALEWRARSEEHKALEEAGRAFAARMEKNECQTQSTPEAGSAK